MSITGLETLIGVNAEARRSAPPLNGGEGGDAMPMAALGMWLFLASEAMFFIAMLGAFIVLESTGQQHQLFVNSSGMLIPWIGILSAVLLFISSGLLLKNRRLLNGMAITASVIFLILQIFQWSNLLGHQTCVYRDPGGIYVSDGNGLTSRQIPLTQPFDLHRVTAVDFSHALPQMKFFAGQKPDILQELNYGPSRNNFFACYFLMSTAHVLHLLAGLLAVIWFVFFRNGKLPGALQNYWHFVNLVGLSALAALYWV